MVVLTVSLMVVNLQLLLLHGTSGSLRGMRKPEAYLPEVLVAWKARKYGLSTRRIFKISFLLKESIILEYTNVIGYEKRIEMYTSGTYDTDSCKRIVCKSIT